LEKVCGYSGLLSILVNQTQNEEKAKQVIEEVKSLFQKLKLVSNQKRCNYRRRRKITISDHNRISLRKYITILQRSTWHSICISSTNGRHKELIALESDRFKRYLAKLFYDNNNNNNNRSVAKTERILTMLFR
jgi:hypothetical protein